MDRDFMERQAQVVNTRPKAGLTAEADHDTIAIRGEQIIFEARVVASGHIAWALGYMGDRIDVSANGHWDPDSQRFTASTSVYRPSSGKVELIPIDGLASSFLNMLMYVDLETANRFVVPPQLEVTNAPESELMG